MIGEGRPVQVKFEVPDTLFNQCERAWNDWGGGPKSSWHEFMEGLLIKALSMRENELSMLEKKRTDGAAVRRQRRSGRLGVVDGETFFSQ